MINWIKVSDIQSVIENAGALVKEVYDKRNFNVELKGDMTPVTEADRASSEYIVGALRKLYPEVPVISEEASLPPYEERVKWKYAWIVDPLDGTKEFIYRNGRFCINIALVEEGRPVFGMINNVCDGEILWAFESGECGMIRAGREEVLVNEPNTASKLKVAVSRFHLTEWEMQYIDYLRSLGHEVELVPLGASSKHCMLAEGKVDICPKFGKCSEWDVAAGQVLVEATGGLVVNAETGGKVCYNKENIISSPFVMFGKRVHEEIKGGNKTFLNFKVKSIVKNDYLGTRRIETKKQDIMEKQYAKELIEFIHESPTNFHAVANAKKELLSNGFKQLFSGEAWQIEKGGKYFVTKNHSSLFAFEIGSGEIAEDGFKIVCAHSDSPTFRIKPNAEMPVAGKYLKLNTEVYGGPIMYTWFDRPLSMAGRVMLRSLNPLKPATQFVNFKRPLMVIPHIAIHFNRAVNDQGNPLSKQKDMLPVIAMINDTFEKDNYLVKLIAEEMGVSPEDILDFDLTLYEYEKGCLFGVNEEFISSGKLDDLAMAHAGLKAFVASEKCRKTKVLAIFDNEEVGSGTKQGAGSPILRTIVERIVFGLGGKPEDLYRAIHNSFMISADMAHALHPNYVEKHDPTNHPVMNGGPVIKFNANQKYVTDGDSAAVFETICKMAGVPCQKFVNHSDMAGGSTLGNILLSQMEMRGVDIGNPMWAMHSVRETGGVLDHAYVIKAFTTFYNI
ncbi:M18 family aminopeptidase [Butyricimonas paravirosa]|uniref:M18 family aminopeptidase n=1 Tax=Butyricimonas paravirosa TaxID=1472417 RepID=UPI003F9CAAA7